jgi:hypothetical protein
MTYIFRVKIEGDNEPEPSVPRLEGNVPFIFVGTKVRNNTRYNIIYPVRPYIGNENLEI